MVTRRRFVQWFGAAGALAMAGCAGGPGASRSAIKGRVVVIGGGFGGATCALYLKRFAPSVEVTLVEPSRRFVTCPFSNAVIGGLRDIHSITFGYEGLKRQGIKVVRDWAKAIDAEKQEVRLRKAGRLHYDHLVVAPGIDFRYDAIPGYSAAVARSMPHAWKAGGQTLLLRRQVQRMRNGRNVFISVPQEPYRCPSAPYERASLIANYLRRHKPRSKVIILDANESFSKQEQFMEGWKELYPGYVEWVPGSRGGKVRSVNRRARTIKAGIKTRRGDVINLIPPQKAGTIAVKAALVDKSGWCPVNPRTFESTLRPKIHVIGDSSIAGAMPKTAYAANSEAKVCAAAIATALEGSSMPEPAYINACYSLLAEDYAISAAGVYEFYDGSITLVDGSGGVSPLGMSRRYHKDEAEFAASWYRGIIADSFSPV